MINIEELKPFIIERLKPLNLDKIKIQKGVRY